jgi:T5SS/PEP-CTERM-associated repeat protein
MRARFLHVALLLVALAPLGLAENNQTTTITTVIDNAGTNYAFGYGVNNFLIITNGGQLTNVAVGFVGRNDNYNGNQNTMIVADPGSAWQSTGALQIGDNTSSAFNRLIISNGAVVSSVASTGNPAIGGLGSFSNSVLVTGSGSVWTNSGAAGLIIGNSGGENSLTISASGTVVSTGGNLSRNSQNSRSNSVVVTDSGSVWNAAGGSLYVGGAGSFNTLTISNGARVIDDGVSIGGVNASDAGASDNSVLVTGSGSLWTNSGTVTVGHGGPRNRLTISAGGRVVSAGGFVSDSASASNNTALVTGSNSLWRQTSTLYIGWSGANNALVVSNGATVWGTAPIVGFLAGATNNSAVVTGAGSVWTNSGTIYLGRQNGASSVLKVLEGGTVYSAGGWLGYNGAGSTNNSAVIAGPGSLWKSTDQVLLGMFAGIGGNTMIISNSGRLLATDVQVGYDANSGSNLVIVSSGGILEANTLGIGATANNRITNRGGVFQFTTAAPTITGPSGAIIVTNGVLSFRAIANASPILSGGLASKVTWQGDNGFQLNSATNAAGLASYTFDSVANTGTASNFQQLVFAGSGSLWRSANLQVGPGGAVSGNGTIQANAVTNQGSLSPGNSPGLLTFTSNLTLLSSSALNMELAGTNSTQFDRLAVNGAFALDGALNVSLIDGFTPQAGDTFKLFDFDVSLLSGAFATTNFGALAEGLAWDTSNLYITGTLGVLNAIPEPGAAALLGGAALVFLAIRRRRV